MSKLDYDEVFEYMKEFDIDYITDGKELVIDYETNTYADISDCEDIETVKVKVVMSICRPVGKGLELKEANRILKKFNKYYGIKLKREDLRLMYGELCYMNKMDEFKDFISRGFPINELKEQKGS